MESKLSIEQLKAGAKSMACTQHIRGLRSIDFEALLVALACERLTRKRHDIISIFESSGKNWNQTFHIMLFKVLGGMDNQVPMTRLAHIVSNYVLMRENSSIVNLEALLLGCSGLLDLYPQDDYIHRLRLEHEHFKAKYGLESMSAEEWNLASRYRANHPTLRLAQLAACLHNKDFSIHSALSCRTSRDVYKLFSGCASPYWLEHFVPNTQIKASISRIGQFKSDLLGINLIAPLIHAYGNHSLDEEFAYHAVHLLEDIAAENNRYTKPWYDAGIEPRDAFLSQALIQLSKEYCSKQRCEQCPLAPRLRK